MSDITVSEGSYTSFHSPAGVDFYRLNVLWAAVKHLYPNKIIPHRGAMTGRQALNEIERYTGNKYKRGEYARAAVDLKAYIETKRAELVIEHRAA